MDVADERAAVEVPGEGPELVGRDVVDGRGGEAGDVGFVRDDRGELLAQAGRTVPVVIVPVRDDLAARVLACDLALRADRAARVDADVAHARRNEIGDGVVTIAISSRLG